jgi:hypothetical protein
MRRELDPAPSRRHASRRLWARQETSGSRVRRGVASVAPGRARRGTSLESRGRSCCPTCRPQSCPAEAGASVPQACWDNASARSPRAQGTRHQAAGRAWAFPGSRIIDTGGQPRTPSRAVRSLESLRQPGSPRLAGAAHHPACPSPPSGRAGLRCVVRCSCSKSVWLDENRCRNAQPCMQTPDHFE